MATVDVVFGVYLDRRGGAIMRAEISQARSSPRQTMRAAQCIRADWPDGTSDQVRAGLEKLAAFAKQRSGTEQTKVAMSSPGPFLSLNHRKRHEGYGTVHPKVGNAPLKGFNLPTLFKEAFASCGGDSTKLRIDVYTDAQACAIGEAVIRNVSSESTLAFVLVTEGIGLGIVRGRTPVGSALHSEFGMMPVRWDRDDERKPPQEERLYGRSLSQLAENKAVRARMATRRGQDRNPSNLPVTEHDIPSLRLRAYYLAQGCLACAVMVAPHKIVLGADMDYNDSVASMTNEHFRKFIESRNIDGEPVFDFEEINQDDYISIATSIPISSDIPRLHVTGSLGLCHVAASADYQAEEAKQHA